MSEMISGTDYTVEWFHAPAERWIAATTVQTRHEAEDYIFSTQIDDRAVDAKITYRIRQNSWWVCGTYAPEVEV